MRKRIFILDDDEAFRADLGEFLVMHGHVVNGADHVSAQSFPQLTDYDLLLLDLSLPGLDGTDVLRELSRLPACPKVVLISGSGTDVLNAVADAARLLGTPVLGGLKKPFDPAELLVLLSSACTVQRGNSRCVDAFDGAELAAALSVALDHGTLEVMFQPKVSAQTLRFRGAELLLSNDLPGIGFVPVPLMIEAASRDPALMARLATYTIQKGIDGCSQWQALGLSGAVSINLPRDVLLSGDVARLMGHMAQELGVRPASIICELTEDALYDSSSESLMALAQLRLAGFGLALDDVGQRNSGLLQLARLPVTELKIDMDLLHRARNSEKAGSIFASLVDLGHRLGMQVVAEGVETEGDLVAARSDGVDLIQGFLVARKMPICELLNWLNKQDTSRTTDTDTNGGGRDERAGEGDAPCVAGG